MPSITQIRQSVNPDSTPTPCCDPSESAPCVACMPAVDTDLDSCEPTPEDLASLHDWYSETTAREYLDPTDGTFTMAELVDRQADFYAGWNNPVGRMLAGAMTELALKIRLTDASTPAELEDRLEILDADVRDQWEAIGYEAGRASCQGPAGFGFGHMA